MKQTLQTVNQPLVIMVGHVWRNMVQQLAVFVPGILLELSAQHAFLVSFLLQFNASETVLSCDEQSIFLLHVQIHSYPLLAPYRCTRQMMIIAGGEPKQCRRQHAKREGGVYAPPYALHVRKSCPECSVHVLCLCRKV